MTELLTIDEEGALRSSQWAPDQKRCLENSADRPQKRVCGPCRRIPCRARSLSNQHNGETAYFDIPHGAPHGFLLSCSHEECIKSGRRFRYCKVCELPVAKRNFVKRHGHDLVHSAKELRETVDRMVSCQVISSPDLEEDSDEPSFHEVSSEEDNLENLTTETHRFIRRSVSFDETKHNVVAVKESFLELGAHEELWLPPVQETPATEAALDPMNIGLQQPVCNVVPPSPLTQPSVMSSENMETLFGMYPKVVPLVEPGARITEDEFEEAVEGIDFSKVFD